MPDFKEWAKNRLGPWRDSHTRPLEKQPYFEKGGWGNVTHGRTYYITEKGLDYYHGSFEQYPKSNQDALWIQTLFDNAPQTKAAFVDQTNDLYNQGITKQDHHEAEATAAELYKRGYLTFNADEAAEY